MAAEPPASPMVSHEDRAVSNESRPPVSIEYFVTRIQQAGSISFLSSPFSGQTHHVCVCSSFFSAFVERPPTKMIDGIHANDRQDKDPRTR